MEFLEESPPSLDDAEEEEAADNTDHHENSGAEEEAELTTNNGAELRQCIANLRSELGKAKKVFLRKNEKKDKIL
jgi:hypothetical protein